VLVSVALIPVWVICIYASQIGAGKEEMSHSNSEGVALLKIGGYILSEPRRGDIIPQLKIWVATTFRSWINFKEFRGFLRRCAFGKPRL